ncbi:segregation/condensation protein A [Siccirubricoccus sp. KC 17139]|uniref:Segregation and condensation protein A n=1 Tax=Siccirubricoccus soli TaxID=2899147 RepID=A0ABT1D7Q3_9PROT|nr:segregation/condensation protein A [Siccirubricoccus soli]MCO6417952.1 segregation/condensation protein A [Siccirubricoccus soli]MCP2684087.1 segregation/condensation protein A [Siccirubricoccus soli]
MPEPVPPEAAPLLRLGAYEGPLDLLLELAKAQQMDLARLSMLALAEAFLASLNAAIAARRLPLATLGDWLVMAATLLALRTRLLLPPGTAEHRAATEEAAALRRRLAEREHIRRLAAWLEQRPQLGQEVFARGTPAPDAAAPPAADVTELLRACLKLLELPARELVYRPALPPLWRVPQALAHLAARLPALPPEGLGLAALLPPAPDLTATQLQRRAALASTLLASLELAREGALGLHQQAPFGEIRLAPPPGAAPRGMTAA